VFFSFNLLYRAAEIGDLAAVKALIAQEVDVNKPSDGTGRTAVFVAATLEILKVIDL
jgi:hypothetical protein